MGTVPLHCTDKETKVNTSIQGHRSNAVAVLEPKELSLTACLCSSILFTALHNPQDYQGDSSYVINQLMILLPWTQVCRMHVCMYECMGACMVLGIEPGTLMC